jgi:hypothetical protein
MQSDGADSYVWPMSETYAVVWREPDKPVQTGRLELLDDGFRLAGTGQGNDSDLVVAARDVTSVRVGHHSSERLREMKTVIVERGDASPISIAAINGLGAVLEIADLLNALHTQLPGLQTVLVRVPIHPKRLADVHALIRRGPPFPPGEIAGLRRHEVFLEDQAVIFLFQGHNVRTAVERLARHPAVWKAAIDWRVCVSGRPTIVDSAYQWTIDTNAPTEQHSGGPADAPSPPPDYPPGIR